MILIISPIALNLIPQIPSVLVNCLSNASMYIVEPLVILDIYLGLKNNITSY